MQKSSNQVKMSDAHVEEAARLFAILSEASRLYLLRELMGGARTVTELVEVTGLKQGNVSKHLGVLQQAAFVAREQDGNFARYSICDKRVAKLCELMCQRIQAEAQHRASLFA